jgi:hypothetical protein
MPFLPDASGMRAYFVANLQVQHDGSQHWCCFLVEHWLEPEAIKEVPEV